jgi:hypothetical protein
VLHLRPPNNDLVLTLTTLKGEDIVGELVGILGSKYLRIMGRTLDVQVLTFVLILRHLSGVDVMITIFFCDFS